MCDTMVATGSVTGSSVTIFAKNSDREPNEGQHVLSIPASKNLPGSKVCCTYLEIEQAAKTHAVLLSKPFWIWGAEMGVNEHGLAIGNEAVFTRLEANTEPALLGMDLVRLALERAVSARQGVDVITSLLKRYGQGGNCSNTRSFYYDNSFLLADPHEAWLLETAGKHWAAKRIDGVYAISNGLTISNDWDLASEHLVSNAIERGWCSSVDDFDFARCYSDPARTSASACIYRRGRAEGSLNRHSGKITVGHAIATLRDHGVQPGPMWSPATSVDKTVCMHTTGASNQISQTTGSLVAYLHPKGPLCFITATAAPCLSVFKPAWPDLPVPQQSQAPTDRFDGDSLFWRHELLHRAVLEDYPNRSRLHAAERDQLEARFTEAGMTAIGTRAEQRDLLAKHCFEESAVALERWQKNAASHPTSTLGDHSYDQAWQTLNSGARMPKASCQKGTN